MVKKIATVLSTTISRYHKVMSYVGFKYLTLSVEERWLKDKGVLKLSDYNKRRQRL